MCPICAKASWLKPHCDCVWEACKIVPTTHMGRRRLEEVKCKVAQLVNDQTAFLAPPEIPQRASLLVCS